MTNVQNRMNRIWSLLALGVYYIHGDGGGLTGGVRDQLAGGQHHGVTDLLLLPPLDEDDGQEAAGEEEEAGWYDDGVEELRLHPLEVEAGDDQARVGRGSPALEPLAGRTELFEEPGALQLGRIAAPLTPEKLIIS